MVAPPGKAISGLIVIIIILALAAGAIFFFRPKPQKLSEGRTTPTPTVQPALKTWKDPAGFTIQYPEGMVINPHEDDNQNYAHLELMHPDHSGSLIVWVKDTSSADVNAWVKTEKQFADANVIDSTLGGEKAKKVLVQDPQAKLFTGTIYDELLWLIEADLTDKEFWQTIHTDIVESFAFVQPEDASASVDTGDSYVEDYAVDEEEVLE